MKGSVLNHNVQKDRLQTSRQSGRRWHQNLGGRKRLHQYLHHPNPTLPPCLFVASSVARGVSRSARGTTAVAAGVWVARSRIL
jgi:hypothetical protein